MFNDLIDDSNCVDCSSESFDFEQATFKRDFGPWKQGYTPKRLMFNLETAEIVEQDEEGNEVVKCKFQLTPVAE